jgi:hypothetical protein
METAAAYWEKAFESGSSSAAQAVDGTNSQDIL